MIPPIMRVLTRAALAGGGQPDADSGDRRAPWVYLLTEEGLELGPGQLLY